MRDRASGFAKTQCAKTLFNPTFTTTLPFTPAHPYTCTVRSLVSRSRADMEYDFSPNPNAIIQVLQVGNEKQPVLIVDDCLLHPQSAVEYAATSVQFSTPKQMYPGIVGPAPRQYAMSLLNVIALKLRDMFN